LKLLAAEFSIIRQHFSSLGIIVIEMFLAIEMAACVHWEVVESVKLYKRRYICHICHFKYFVSFLILLVSPVYVNICHLYDLKCF
jgi:hypothetical protein